MNAAIDLLRQRSRRPQTLSLDDPDLPPVPDPAEDPQAQAEAQERRRQLWQAIDALPEVHRTPFLLREMEGYSYREIAKAPVSYTHLDVYKRQPLSPSTTPRPQRSP